MRTRAEVKAMLEKLRAHRAGLSWWDDGITEEDAIINTLLWVLGVTTDNTIDPEKWEQEETEG